MDGIGHDSGITSKLNTLLRLGLVSKNNIRRAAVLFQDPDKAMKNPAYRMLMQEILVDVVDRVLNNRNLYTALRTSLSKESNLTTEGVEGERTKTLLRSGLVKKKDVIVARRALQSPETAIKMGASKVYRDLMIDMMDSMVKKITGSPVLFNAFRKTLGGETVEESFETPNTESMDEFGLVEAAQELMEENKPTNPELWSQAKSKARAKFDVYPSAYANGWAVKWYNEQGGDWKSVSEGKTFFDLQRELNEYMTTMNRKSPKENATARDKARKLRDEMETMKLPKPKQKTFKEANDCMIKATELMQSSDIAAAETMKPKKGKKKVNEASEVTEIYRITPARRAVLDKIKDKATSDANRVTDEDDYSSKGLRDSKVAHARMRRVDLIKMMGKPSDKRTAEEHPDLKYTPKNSTPNQLKDRELKADLKHARKIERPIVKKKVNEASEVTEIYRITPARRAVLDKIKDKATSDANRVTDEDDYSSKGLRDSKVAHARMRRVDLIKMMGKPSDKRTAEEHPDLKYTPKNSTPNQLKDRELKADLKHARKIERPIVKKKVNEASGVTAKLQGLKADYAKHAEELRKPIPPARGSTHPMARMGKGKKMEWAKDRRKKAGSGSKRASDVSDERSGSVSEGIGAFALGAAAIAAQRRQREAEQRAAAERRKQEAEMVRRDVARQSGKAK